MFGLAEKDSTGLLALRFRDNNSLSKFAIEHKMDDTSSHARWKLTGFPIQGGLHALDTLLSQKGWRDVHVLFLDEKQADFSAPTVEKTFPCFGVRVPKLTSCVLKRSTRSRALLPRKTARQLLPQQLLQLPFACAPVSPSSVRFCSDLTPMLTWETPALSSGPEQPAHTPNPKDKKAPNAGGHTL